MKVLTFFTRTIVVVGVIAIGVFLSPQLRAQEVLAGSATGAEAQAAQGATAAGTGSVAGGTNAVAGGAATDATAIGNNAQATGAEGPTAYGAGSLASGDDSVAVGGAGGSVVGAHATSGGSIAVGVLSTSSNFGSVSIGSGSNASGAGSIAIGGGNSGAFSVNSANASGDGAIAIGTHATAAFTNSTALGIGATTTRANQMAFGTGTNTYTMAGVTSAASLAAQTGPTEFVTTDLAGNLAAFDLGPAFSSLNSRITHLRNRIENTRSEEQGGIALAIASGQIRYDDRPGKVSIGGGVGGFEHEAGGALGIGYTAPNSRVRMNVSAGGSTHGDFGGGGGLSITLN